MFNINPLLHIMYTYIMCYTKTNYTTVNSFYYGMIQFHFQNKLAS